MGKCGKCEKELSNFSIDYDNPGRSAGICEDHGVVYANPAEYE